MNTKYFITLFASLFLLAFTTFASELDTLLKPILAFDMFYGNSIISQNNAKNLKSIEPNLMYDFSSQYPYYTNQNKLKLKKCRQVGLSFNKLPNAGFIYIFCADERENFTMLNEIDLSNLALSNTHGDSSYNQKIIINSLDSNLLFNFKTKGEKKICIIYSTEFIPNYRSLILGLEMTNGNFLKRLLVQLGKSLLLPNSEWSLLSSSFGFFNNLDGINHFNHNKSCKYEGPILPIYIKLNIK
jgi:hypothetical protein